MLPTMGRGRESDLERSALDKRAPAVYYGALSRLAVGDGFCVEECHVRNSKRPGSTDVQRMARPITDITGKENCDE
jgi:hypothetical protein